MKFSITSDSLERSVHPVHQYSGNLKYDPEEIKRITNLLIQKTSRDTAASTAGHTQAVDELFDQLISHLDEANAQTRTPLVVCLKNFYEEFKRATSRSSTR
jgi:hypothetical protein